MAKKRFGKWQIVDQLSEGGQAHTYIVENSEDPTEDPRVLKRLKNVKRFERFERELRICLELSHPNVIQVINYDLDCDPPFIIYPYCSGGTLESCDLSQSTLCDRLRLFAAICDGVGYAHSSGVVHRDLKPDNIFFDKNGRPIVADFGIAFVDESGHRLTLTEEVAGPRFYTAPELEAGRLEEITSASDVYSLGKLLYWVISGQIFPRERFSEEQYDLTEQGESIELSLIYERLFDRSIRENPGDRFSDANELKDEVYRVISLFETRTLFFDRARCELGLNRAGSFLCTFTPGSLPHWYKFNPSFQVHGFASKDRSLAWWGIEQQNDISRLHLLAGTSIGRMRDHHIDTQDLVERPSHPSHRRYRNLAFAPNGHPAFAYTEGGEKERVVNRGYRLNALLFDETHNRYKSHLISDDVGRSMGGEFAISNEGALAVYHPSTPGGAANPGVHPETIVQYQGKTDRYEIGSGQTWSSPIAFGRSNVLYQAIVVEFGGSEAHRELQFYERTEDGDWTRETIVAAKQLSAAIAMAVGEDWELMIISQFPDATNAIAIFTKDRGIWKTTEVGISHVATEYGCEQIRTDAILDAGVCDEGALHIVLLTDLPRHLETPTMKQGILYLRVEDSHVSQHRMFPIKRFIGFGLGAGDTVHLSVELA